MFHLLSRVTSLVYMLIRNSLKPVLIALPIAIPVAWWAGNKWLEGFAYRIDVRWWMFAFEAVSRFCWRWSRLYFRLSGRLFQVLLSPCAPNKFL